MEYIDTAERLSELAHLLSGAPLVAADTEAAGYHRYGDGVCVFQLSTRSNTYLIDTLAVEELHPLQPLLADSGTEVIFHDADYDLRLLNRDFGVVVRGLFDTKIAAQFLGEPAFGLASLTEKYLDVRLDKSHQRADWAQRPLPPELLSYAAQDTEYLPALRDRVREELSARGRLHWAEEEFGLQQAVRWDPVQNGLPPFLRLKGTRDFTPRQLAALRELHAWRERLARQRDLAPFRVMMNEVLAEIARRMPERAEELAEIAGMPRPLLERRADELIETLRHARTLPETELPARPRGPRRPPVEPDFDQVVERLKAARDAVAERLGLDRGFLMPRQQLEELARHRPRVLEEIAAIPGIRRWQVEVLGEELLDAATR